MRHFSFHAAGHTQHTGFPIRQDSATKNLPLRGDLAAHGAQEQEAQLHDTDLARAGEGAGVGSAVGGALGMVVALGATSGSSWVVPGLGMELAVPLVAVITGAGVGAVIGGAFGALMGWLSPDGDLL